MIATSSIKMCDQVGKLLGTATDMQPENRRYILRDELVKINPVVYRPYSNLTLISGNACSMGSNSAMIYRLFLGLLGY
ncbi:hypothetical protein B9S53_00140 [Arthrospira sp. O9.13F]|nr:hypothetical protein B9S53_00140 [Arthrospira sp. O9.13F]